MRDLTSLVDECLESEDIHCIDWPPRPPELNSIEHARNALERAITTRKPLYKNYSRLENAVAERVKLIATGTHKLHYFQCSCPVVELTCLPQGEHTPQFEKN
ncbi:hypothetical protein TNCV_5020811 [Trichonephila clavipes]|nr:hypothetical protein TNCV_5020811 [Trichonephila clavipes]